MSEYLDYRARQIGFASYAAYLQSAHWREFREKVLAEVCAACRKYAPGMQVHHITYDNLGAELPSDVMTLCDTCHAAVHRIARARNGVSLEEASLSYHPSRKKTRQPQQRHEWVSWFKLVNKSKHQTLDQLRIFLVQTGLSDGEKATEDAYRRGMVRLIDGKERWNLRRYIRLMQNDKKRQKRARKHTE